MVRTKTRGILWEFGTRVGARAVAALLQAAVLLFAAREVGAGEFGDFSVGFSATAILCVVLNFGINVSGLRVGTSPSRGTVANLAWLGLLLSFLGGAMLSAGLSVLNVSSIAIVGCWLAAADFAGESAVAVMSGRGWAGRASALILCRRLGSAAAFAVLWREFGSIDLALWGSVSVSGLMALGACGTLGRPVFTRLAHVLRESRRYWGTSLAGQVAALDVVVVRLLGGAELAGLYAAAVRASYPVALVASSLMTVFAPRLMATPDATIELVTRQLRRVAIGLAVAVFLLSPMYALVVIFVLGDEYQEALTIVVAMVCALGISLISQARQAEFVAAGWPGQAALAVLTGTIGGLMLLGGFALWGRPEVLGMAMVVLQASVLMLLLKAWARARVRAAIPMSGGRIGA